jgi:hypothetical protein
MFESLGVQVRCQPGGGEGLEKRKGVVARRSENSVFVPAHHFGAGSMSDQKKKASISIFFSWTSSSSADDADPRSSFFLHPLDELNGFARQALQ